MGLTRPQISGGYAAIRDAAIAAARRNNAALWYAGNSSDLTGFVYQDSTGTTPATSGGGVGSNTLSAADSAFTAFQNWTLSGGAAVVTGNPGYITVGPSTSFGYASVSPAFVSGTSYRITFTVTDYVSGAVTPLLGGVQSGTARSANGTFTEDIVSTVNSAFMYIYNAGPSAFVGRVTNVIVQVISGGDPIGLMLDRSYGAGNRGTERVTNGDFSNGATGWSASGTGAIISVSSGQMTVTNGAAVEAGAVPTGSVEIGKTYFVSCLRVGGSAPGFVVLGSQNLPINGAAGIKTGLVGPITGSTGIRVATGNATLNDAVTFDDLSIREVLGFPALQATAANKPTLELQANGYYGMRFDGSNDQLKTTIQQVSAATSAIAAYKLGAAPTGYIMGAVNAGVTAGSGFDCQAATLTYSAIGTGTQGSATSVVANTPIVNSYVLSGSGKVLYQGGGVIGNAAGSFTITTAADALWALGNPGSNFAGINANMLATLFCVSPVALSDADRIAIERFAALLSGASYV